MISPESLRRYPFFAESTDSTLKAIAMSADERPFKAGDRLFEESGSLKAGGRLYEKSQTASHLMIVVKGEVDLTNRLGSGREAIVSTAVAGDLLGLSSMIEPYELTASGLARTDGVLIRIDAARLRQLCEDDHTLGYHLMSQIARELRNRLQHAFSQLAGMS